MRGKNKLGDRWEKHPHKIINVPNSGLPVYKVQREDLKGKVRTLHRNLLLPFMFISDDSLEPQSVMSQVQEQAEGRFGYRKRLIG